MAERPPAGVRLAVHSGNGDVSVTGAHAELIARSGNGRVRVTGTAGEVDAASGNGEVTVENVRGPVSANSGNGDVRVSTVQGPVSARSGNGDLLVRMTELRAADDMEFTTGNGRIEVTVPAFMKEIIAEDQPFEGELRLIHDLPGGRWSWGADASLAHHEREFRLDEARVEGMGTAFGAYVEFRPRADWRFRLEADNIGSASLTDTRRKFAGSRASGIIDSIERRRLRTSTILSLSARKSFGGAGD